MSNATVIPPSLATKNPGTSAVSIIKSSSLSSMEVSFIEPLQPLFFSITPISLFPQFEIKLEICFMCFPCLGPIVLKLGFIFFFRKVLSVGINSNSLMLSSERIKLLTARILFSNVGFSAGTISFCKGCRTLIFSFFLNPKTSEQIRCARDIFSSRSTSI